jgi:hypothetical protein
MTMMKIVENIIIVEGHRRVARNIFSGAEMTFHEWEESASPEAKRFRERIEAEEQGNPYNPMLAARMAYEAGIAEGRRLAADAIAKIALKG